MNDDNRPTNIFQPSVRRQKVAVIGAGALGTIISWAAHVAGNDVTLCARTPMQTPRVDTKEGSHEVPVHVATVPERQGAVDWILIATKAQDTASTRAWISAMTGPDTVVVVVQNGIAHRRRVEPYLPAGVEVIPAVPFRIAAERLTPGRVLYFKDDQDTFLIPEGPAASRLVGVFAGSFLRFKEDGDFKTSTWHKLLINSAWNPITALTMRRGDVFRDRGIADFARGILLETAQVARAEGANICNDQVEKIIGALLHQSGDIGSSMLYDRLAGHSTEYDYISGAVVRTASMHGIHVPLNKLLLSLTRAADPHRAD
ncbi:2-dehydropantoate 2-reductase [Amycolatopsis sp. NPDC005232]|uniref:2-dehydropantoate 2-reductase n=1 Tax=Amycolatopsis sp. NPDC005232 TaxID=3157027 RepID=UPI0033A4C92F